MSEERPLQMYQFSRAPKIGPPTNILYSEHKGSLACNEVGRSMKTRLLPSTAYGSFFFRSIEPYRMRLLQLQAKKLR
jgi:hypothetical protein